MSRDDHPRSVAAANPWRALYSAAVWPLARQLATRCLHVSLFAIAASRCAYVIDFARTRSVQRIR
ncbi:MAG TPA: hypothetical protein VNO30_03860, partial [Kofleriaceae bacterium]|nr:hypothetical protein [Kofleriaceae bacterium]